MTQNRIYYHPYRLRMKSPPNSRTPRAEATGVLIRHGDGYGCIQPWPELGDPPLQKCLADLAGPRRWPIVRRALRCAEYDQAARHFEHSLFEEMEIPESHATLTECSETAIAHAADAGFSTAKIKLGPTNIAQAAEIAELLTAFPMRWRFDFNETLDPASAAAFLREIPPELRSKIDFIEDPCPYATSTWNALFREFRVSLAVDREAAPERNAAQMIIVKPAIDEPFFLAEAALAAAQRIVVTSYMDHPVGQTFAAWEAARLALQFPGLVGLCGFQTHHLFQPDAFTAQLGDWRPAFQPPDGHGLGFTDLLESLPWTAL